MRKNSQNNKVTLARCVRFMKLMHKEMTNHGHNYSKGLSKELVRLLNDVHHQNVTPPPIPLNIQSLQRELELERSKVVELTKGIDEVSTIALNYKAEAMAERVENQSYVKALAGVLPEKIKEAMSFANEKVSEGRDLRVQQVLHSLDRSYEGDVDKNN